MINVKRLYGRLLQILIEIAGVDAAKKFDTLLRFHKRLNLKNPVTLSDKVTYIELHEQLPLAVTCSDKYDVRDYIKSKGLENILIPLEGGVWDKIDDINFSVLPDSFVLKATHGCKMNFLVPDKSKLDMEKCKKEMRRWMDTTYGTYSVEPHYALIPHRIYAEAFLGNADKLIDYKFHCMNGVPRFVLVCSNRIADGDNKMSVTRDIFNVKWQPMFGLIPSHLKVPSNVKVEKPRNLNKMLEVARILSKDFKFVRVDLYEIDGEIYFGELTFTPACGVFSSFTDKFDTEMGKLLTL